MVDLMHFCMRLKAKRPKFDYTTNRYEITVYYPTHLMTYLAAFPEWSCFRLCVFIAKQKISPHLLNFGLKVFCSFCEFKFHKDFLLDDALKCLDNVTHIIYSV